MIDFKAVLKNERKAVQSSIVFSARQQAAYNAALSGANCFITGPGGVGKSELVKAIVKELRSNRKTVAVTASTGIAAIAVGGTTIHSFLKTGIAGCKARQLRRMGPNSVMNAQRQIEGVDTIIIDEVSMLTGDFIDMFDWWMGMVMDSPTRVFGGKQVILVGDFLQLPPVVTDTDSDKIKNRYAFQADCWARANFHECYLNKSYRQDNAEFVKHLNRIRRGILANDTIEYFQPCVKRELEDPTRLFPTNSEARNYNLKRLEELPGEPWVNPASFTGDERWFDNLKNNCIAEELLEIKIGAPVIFVQNLPGAYTNGERATVLDISPEGSVKVQKTNGHIVDVVDGKWDIHNAQERILATMNQIPLKLAWALTMHKSQGMSLERVAVDLSCTFESGMSYVSLSRAKSPEGLSLAGPLQEDQIITSRKCVEFYADLSKRMKGS